jgi:F420-dependent oxidoreductase-like protein
MARPWPEILRTVQYAESTGWSTCYVYDHFMPNTPDGAPADGPVLEGWTVLSALAAVTDTIRLGTMVLGATYRHPAVLANMAATLDQISEGRLILGMGAGWQVNEHAVYGIELPPPRELLDRFEETCAILTSLFSQPRTTFHGTAFEILDAPCDPKPRQQPLPLLIGGRGEKRTMRIAARYADIWNAWTTPEILRHKQQVLNEHCADLSRDPSSIRRSTQAMVTLTDRPTTTPLDSEGRLPRISGTPDQVAEILAQYADAGADEFLIPDFDHLPLDEHLAMLDILRTRIAPSLM